MDPMEFLRDLWFEVGITPAQALGVIIAATVMYITFTVVLRVWGQRLYANRSGTGLAVVLVLGSVVGRSILGPNVTVLGGLIALAMLVLLESFFGAGRRAGLFGHRRAIVIYANKELDDRAIRRFHVDRRNLWARLRQSGITDLDHVHALILETDGSITILRHGDALDPRLLTNVRGADKILD